MIETKRDCEGLLDARPHHTRLAQGNRCQSAAKTLMGDKWLCLRCAKKATRLSIKREVLRLVLESKWPTSDPDRMTADGFVDGHKIDEVVDLLLPLMRTVVLAKVSRW